MKTMKNLFFKVASTKCYAVEDSIYIEGLAVSTGVNRYDEMVDPLALATGLSNYMVNPILLLQHDQNKQLGAVEELTPTPEGLFVKARVSYDVDNVKQRILNGDLKCFSICFNVKEWSKKTVDGKTYPVASKIELLEISVVTLPADPNAIFTLSRSLSLAIEEMEAENAPEAPEKVEAENAPEIEVVAEVVEPTETVEPATPETIEQGLVVEIEVKEEEPEAEMPEAITPEPSIDMETELLACKEKIQQLEESLISLVSQMLQMQSSVEATTTKQQALEIKAQGIESDMLKIPVNKPTKMFQPSKSYAYNGNPSSFYR